MVRLETFIEKDISKLLLEVGNEDIGFLYQFGGINYKYPLDCNQLKQTIANKSNLLFKVIDHEDNNIGHCQILRLDLENRNATIGRLLIYSKYRGKGLGKLMIQELLRFAKNKLNLKNIRLRVFEFNVSAINCYEKIGFKKTSEEYIDIPNFNEKWKIISMEVEI